MTDNDNDITTEDIPDTIAEILEKGEYRHTFFEMWSLALEDQLRATEAPLDLNVASGILGSYPWLTHGDLNAYRTQRADLLREALAAMDTTLGEQRGKIFNESVEDWSRHKKLYMALIAEWNLLTISWGNGWTLIAQSGQPDPVGHAAIGDVSGLLLNNEYGIVEGLKTLKGFKFEDEDRKELNKMMGIDDDDE